MAINSYGDNLAINGAVGTSSTEVKDNTKLGKDDFMKLFLVQLQHQDPTEPMDTEKILTQTTQLATIESTDNTNKALEDLANSLKATQDFSTIAAIGKRADLGSDAIAHEEGVSTSFEMYFPEDVWSGTIDITDSTGKVVSTMDIQEQKDENGDLKSVRESGIYQFTWDGKDSNGNTIESGIYHVNASYLDQDGTKQETRIGAYPIESVRFEDGKALVKLGSNYVSLDQVKEIY